jgi:NAD(P)-dependent dehydrogenase (short-subunit alcohol dehydrogenase family)
MDRLKDKIAVVTGAGNGIGRATAALFGAEGAFVYVTDVNGETAEETVAQMKERGHGAKAVSVDVSRGQDVTALFRDVQKEHGRIDVLVNNAGINVRSDFRNMSDSDWVRLREVNLDGMVRVARDGFSLLKASGRGSLINLASIMGHRGMRPLAAYAATKGAISALTRALAVEYAPFQIRVNALAPGFIETAITERILKVPQFRSALLERTPMGRFGTSEEVAAAALFFASDESAYVTGAELAIDGGMAASL